MTVGDYLLLIMSASRLLRVTASALVPSLSLRNWHQG